VSRIRRRTRLLSIASLCGGVVLVAGRARAVDVAEVGGEPLSASITNTATFNWHFDNRNDLPFQATGRVDDSYGELIDRLNVQINWWRLTLGARLDGVKYFDTTTPEEAYELGKEDYRLAEAQFPGAQHSANEYATRYYQELHTRFLDTYYPSKLSLSYTQPGVDATVGDFYAQLGRGLVLSVRKLDEVAIDTTIRGGKLVLDHDFGSFRAGLTALGGLANPVRFDVATGRRLHGDGSPIFFGFPKISGFEYWASCGNGDPACFVDRVDPPQASYLEDTILGGRVEAGTEDFLLAANGAQILRKLSDASVTMYSGSVNLPSIADKANVYVEVAGQSHELVTPNPNQELKDASTGYAAYSSVGVHHGPISVTLEGKHYRRYGDAPDKTGVRGSAVPANIDPAYVDAGPAFEAPEFAAVAYNQPPTAEPIYVEAISGGAPNTCITGGRGNVDFRFSKDASVFGWLGRYVSFSEIPKPNPTCKTDAEFQTNTWDAAIGSELHLEHGRSHGRAWVGGRTTNYEEATESANTALTTWFYREGYVRYDVLKHIAGPFSLQFQGFHRRRYEPVSFQDSWTEGENYTALHWAPHLVATFGYEYTSQLGCEAGSDAKLCHYVSGALQWKSGSGDTVLEQVFDTVQLFVGQRRGAIRCVSGVCRKFEPFEGAKIELVSRF
jgi:hypothetical protein